MAFTHVFEYRVAPGHEAEVVGYVRHSILPEPLPPGATKRCVARRLSQGGPEYVAVTVWEDLEAFEAGTAPSGIPRSLMPIANLLVDCSSTVYRIAAAMEVDREEARILRIYRTIIADLDLERWENKAQGSAAALAARTGLMAVHAGVDMQACDVPDAVGVAALTAWRDWASVISATGGHLDRFLLGTEPGDLEYPGQSEHYQLLELDSAQAETRPAGQQPDSSG